MRSTAIAFLATALTLAACTTDPQSGPPSARTPLQPPTAFGDPVLDRPVDSKALLQDIALIDAAFRALHPGLYVHQPEREWSRRVALFSDAARAMPVATSLGQAYLFFAELVATVEDGHTIINPLNQNEDLRAALARLPRLPFAFTWVEDEAGLSMIVTGSAIPDVDLPTGAQIVSINGYSPAELLALLATYREVDGGNRSQLLATLGVRGDDPAAPFDILFALAILQGSRDLEIAFLHPDGIDERTTVRTRTVPFARRRSRLARASVLPWELTYLENDAILRLSTFTTWNFSFDWERFLTDAFREINASGATRLVLDIRGNAGGLTEVIELVAAYVADPAHPIQLGQTTAAYTSAPADLRPHLNAWDPSLLEPSALITGPNPGATESDNRRYLVDFPTSLEPARLPADVEPFSGPVGITSDGSNRSATFTLLAALADQPHVTVVGTPSGGSSRGTTGSQFMFLTLPGTGIAVDTPLLHTPMAWSVRPQSTADGSKGVHPDVIVAPTSESIAAQIDPMVIYLRQTR